jgi:hypothetical protein
VIFEIPLHGLLSASPAVYNPTHSFGFRYGSLTERLHMNPKIAAFVFGAALAWGVYVPIVHEAQAKLGSSLRAFILVGVAYFLVAVLVPSLLVTVLKADPTAKDPAKLNWASSSVIWGLLAGISGAAGALCVIFATRDARVALGDIVGPLVVAPLVFAGAPIINTIATLTIFSHGKKYNPPGMLFYLGLLLAASGMVMVMVFKPKPVTAAPGGPAKPAATAAANPAAAPAAPKP